MTTSDTGRELLWAPSEEQVRASRMTAYLDWLGRERGLRFAAYEDLWRWSVEDLDGFWRSIWDYFDVLASAPRRPRFSTTGGCLARPGFQAHGLTGPRTCCDTPTATVRLWQGSARTANRSSCRGPSWPPRWPRSRLRCASWGAAGRPGGRLPAQHSPGCGRAAGHGQRAGRLVVLRAGLRYQRCVDRFQQIAPAVLIAVDGYRFGGKGVDRGAVLAELGQQLPSVRHAIVVRHMHPDRPAPPGALTFDALSGRSAAPHYELVPFEHPLWILYSSGTTGLPKGIVQSQGGILIEHLKLHELHFDTGPDDRVFILASTAWMVWNPRLGAVGGRDDHHVRGQPGQTRDGRHVRRLRAASGDLVRHRRRVPDHLRTGRSPSGRSLRPVRPTVHHEQRLPPARRRVALGLQRGGTSTSPPDSATS